jgi:hypothetical protein
MSIILLENDKKIKNLFNAIFGTINFNDNNDDINYDNIKFLLYTDEIRTVDMLDEIYKVLSNNLTQNEVNNIFINYGIITNRNDPKFSILSSSNSLLRSLEQASFYNSSNNVSLIKNNIDNLTQQKYDNFTLGYPYSNNLLDFNTFYEYIPQNENKVQSYNDNVEYQKPYKNDEIIESFEETKKNQYYYDEKLNDKLASLEEEISNIKLKSDIDCETKINDIKSNLNNQIIDIKNKSKDSIDNYIKLLTDILLKNQVITQIEVDNINRNLNSNLIDINTVINYLENKKKLAKNLTINYNFDNIYLNKWNVPLPRPPICISDDPVKIKQIDQYSSNFSPFYK